MRGRSRQDGGRGPQRRQRRSAGLRAYHERMILPVVLVGAFIAQSAPAISVIPLPVRVTERSGHFTIKPATTIWSDVASDSIARQFVRDVEPATGYTLRARTGGA